MRASLRSVVPVVLGLLMGGSAQAQWQKNEYDLQKEHLEKFVPAPLVGPQRQGAGAPTVVRLRFYADEAYRAGGARWSDRMKQMLSDLNRVAVPAFGVRFEGESFRRWDRKGGSGALGPVLEELERLDQGRDVDWVVGLVSPLPMLTMSFHDLGMARVLGRHFVLRGMSSLAEMQDFERIFKALEQQDREKLYGQRKAHKEMSVFLHEWSHTLGLPHVEDASRIMSPGYSQRTSVFSVQDAELIAASLAGRLGSRGREDGATDWSALREHLNNLRNPEWRTSEVEQLKSIVASMSAASGRGRAGAGPGSGGGEAPVPVPPPPGLAGRPRLTPAPAPAPGATSRTGRSTPPAAKAETGLGGEVRALARSGKRAEAVAALKAAEESAKGDLAAKGRIYADLARMHAELGSFSTAEQTLAKSGDSGSEEAPRAAAHVQRLRRRFGVPASGRLSLTADRELAHADAFDATVAAFNADQLKEAQATIKTALKQFPGSPGLLTLACEAELRQGRASAAIPRCKQALAGMEELPRAHYLLGCAQAELGQFDPALKSLKRAIILEPKEQAPWESLADLYRHMGRNKEFNKFLAEHGGDAPAAVGGGGARR